MPRIRTIVPEFWEDERFSNVSLPACLLYIGMKNFADDSGVILANETIIKSKVFPAREDIRKQQVSGWLQELIENSILVPFTFENKSYYVMDFSSERIDKPQHSRIIPNSREYSKLLLLERRVKERIVKERRVIRAQARATLTLNRRNPRMKILKSSSNGLLRMLLMWLN